MDKSFVEASEECPSVYKIRFMPSELTSLYSEILSNVTVSGVYDSLCSYVTDSIEPIGWHAIWRTGPNNGSNLSIEYDFEVEVIDVLHNKLEAVAVVLKLIHPNESQLTAEEFDEKDNLLKDIKTVNIPLTQLYVISDEDIDEDYYRTAVIIEHIRFFYQNLWRPWDELVSDDGQDIFVETRLRPRLELAFDIKDKIIPQSTVNRIRKLLTEAWIVKNKIDTIDSNRGLSMDMSIEDNSDVDYINESELIEAMRLKIRLEDIEREMKLLEDKHLRIIAASLKISGDSCSNTAEEEDVNRTGNMIHLIAKKFTIQSIKELSTSLSNVIDETETPVMFHNSLSQALNCVKSGDKIYVMPGLYSCQTLPWIESDIEINGFGGTKQQIILESSDTVGDIFVNCNTNKLVFNGLTLRGTSELQSLVMIHSGFVSFNDCTLDGTNQTRNALIVLSKAKVEIESCKIINEMGNKIVTRKGSTLINRDEIHQNLDNSSVDKVSQIQITDI